MIVDLFYFELLNFYPPFFLIRMLHLLLFKLFVHLLIIVNSVLIIDKRLQSINQTQLNSFLFINDNTFYIVLTHFSEMLLLLLVVVDGSCRADNELNCR